MEATVLGGIAHTDTALAFAAAVSVPAARGGSGVAYPEFEAETSSEREDSDVEGPVLAPFVTATYAPRPQRLGRGGSHHYHPPVSRLPTDVVRRELEHHLGLTNVTISFNIPANKNFYTSSSKVWINRNF